LQEGTRRRILEVLLYMYAIQAPHPASAEAGRKAAQAQIVGEAGRWLPIDSQIVAPGRLGLAWGEVPAILGARMASALAPL